MAKTATTAQEAASKNRGWFATASKIQPFQPLPNKYLASVRDILLACGKNFSLDTRPFPLYYRHKNE